MVTNKKKKDFSNSNNLFCEKKNLSAADAGEFPTSRYLY